MINNDDNDNDYDDDDEEEDDDDNGSGDDDNDGKLVVIREVLHKEPHMPTHLHLTDHPSISYNTHQLNHSLTCTYYSPL